MAAAGFAFGLRCIQAAVCHGLNALRRWFIEHDSAMQAKRNLSAVGRVA
jgi:hypothetical protein